MSSKLPAFLPRNEYVLVKEVRTNTSKGGIVLPANVRTKDEITTGVVEAVPEDHNTKTKELVGKTVLFNRYTGHEIKDTDGLYLVEEKYIIAVVS